MFFDQVNQIGDMLKVLWDVVFIKVQFKKQVIVSFGECIGNIKYLMVMLSEFIIYISGIYFSFCYFELGQGY